MAYKVSQIKVFAYNNEHKDDFTLAEHMLYLELAYCYECFREGYPKEDCEHLMKEYIDYYEQHTSKYSALSVLWNAQNVEQKEQKEGSE